MGQRLENFCDVIVVYQIKNAFLSVITRVEVPFFVSFDSMQQVTITFYD